MRGRIYSLRDPGRAQRLLATGCWLLVAGCWLLASGYWLLAAGYRGLEAGVEAIGCWLLAVVGHWLWNGDWQLWTRHPPGGKRREKSHCKGHSKRHAQTDAGKEKGNGGHFLDKQKGKAKSQSGKEHR